MRGVSVQKSREALASRLREVRRDFGTTQAEFGRRIGLRQSVISKYEKGYPVPKVVRIAIAATFGVSLGWLEHSRQPKYPQPEALPVTSQDLELLRFLKQQSSLYDLIQFRIAGGRPAARRRRSAHKPPSS